MGEPYYSGDGVDLWHGDCREVLPALDLTYDAAVVDPPYEGTSLAWDRWPAGWPAVVAQHTRSMWCFGSMRMFLDRRDEFTGWRMSQDVVWEKRNGTSFAKDRFRRVHEVAAHWYRGSWAAVHHEVPRVPAVHDPKGRDKSVSPGTSRRHTGVIGPNHYWDDGLRLTRSVIHAPSVRRGLSSAQKPVEVVAPLIEYSVPPGGVVLDPMACSGTTAVAASRLGRRCVLIEADEAFCERAARRLEAGVLLAGDSDG